MNVYQAIIGLLRPSGILKAGKLVEYEVGDPAIENLLKAQAIAPVGDVMLEEIPGWAHRAEALSAIGIFNVKDFLAADAEKDSKGLKMSAAEFSSWRTSLMEGWPVGAVPPCNC